MFSVLLSVYKKESPDFFNQALTSIYDDQELKPSQVVLVKDGGLTPSLERAITAWQEKLGDILMVVTLPENVGLGAALNAGLAHCNYELVARMDTDDISLPERFAKQVAFMGENPDIVAASAILEEWDKDLLVKQGVRNLPTDSGAITQFAKRRSPLNHPLAIFRKSVVLEVGGYPILRKAQDYGLWSLLINKGYRLANLPDILLKMRTGDEMLARRGWSYFKQEYQLLKFQKEIGFLSRRDFLINMLLKGGLRMAPSFIKRWAYKFAR